jgi:hypothetical protein
MLKRSVAIALCLAMATAAQAQDGSEPVGQRTVENAQKFLSDFYRGPGFEARFDKPIPYSIGVVVRAESPNRCETVFVTNKARKYEYVAGETEQPVGDPAAEYSHLAKWSELKISVQQEQKLNPYDKSEKWDTGRYMIYVSPRGTGPQGFVLHHPSEDDAKRAANAIQFLIDECGFKSETGF